MKFDLPEGYTKAMDAISARVAAAVGEDCRVIYSAYSEDKSGIPIDNLDEVVHTGRIIFRDNGRSGLEGNFQRWLSKELTNPTWLDLCRAANDLIVTVGYVDHVFLEGISVTGHLGEIAVAEFTLGS